MAYPPHQRPGGPSSASTNAPDSLEKPQQVKYYEAPGQLRTAIVDEEAEEWAKQFTEIAPSQLRRFYEHVLSLRRRLDESDQPDKLFEQLRPEFKMLKPKAIYAAGRKQELRPLRQFFINHTFSVKTRADFQAFCKHFEAVIAFHKFYGDDKKK